MAVGVTLCAVSTLRAVESRADSADLLPAGSGLGRKPRGRGSVGAAVARAVREAPRGARPLLVARRRVVQHLADALDEAMLAGNTLLVIKLNAQLELAIGRAELDVPGEV